MASVSELMRENGIERIVYVPASDLVPHDAFHAWPFDCGGLDHHCGRGETVEDAIADAARRMAMLEAA